VFGTGRHFSWGLRDEALVIWRLEPWWTVVESFPLDAYEQAFRRFRQLERSGHGPRRWFATVRSRVPVAAFEPNPWLMGGLAVVATIVVVVITAVGMTSDREAPHVRPRSVSAGPGAVSGEQENASGGRPLYVDPDAGYRFLYPAGWRLTGSSILDPRGEAVVSFGMVASQGLAEASRLVLDQLGATYSDVVLVSKRWERTAQGWPALAVGAEAVDARSRHVKLLAVTVEGPRGIVGFRVRFAPGSDPLDVLTEIRGIIASFRTM
jgi:hypothetical protein